MTSKPFKASALVESIRAGQLHGVIDALNSGADVEEPDMHGAPGLPLRTACFEGHEAIVCELLSRGANPNASTGDGASASLRLALRRGHQRIAALLLQQGARIPDGLAIDPAALAIAPPLFGEEPVVPSQQAVAFDNMIEFTRTEINLASADSDMTETFGTETKLLSMNLLFLEEKDSPAEQGKPPTT